MYDNGLIPEEDWELLTSGKYGRRIEIDNVIAYVEAERFWKESVITSLAELFNTADYNLSLRNVEYVMLPNLRLLNKVAEKAGAIAAADEVNKLKQDYTDYDISTKGFIEDIDAIEKENTKRIEKNELEDDHIQWLEEQLASIEEEFSRRTGMFVYVKLTKRFNFLFKLRDHHNHYDMKFVWGIPRFDKSNFELRNTYLLYLDKFMELKFNEVQPKIS
jgi:hypothetical protein